MATGKINTVDSSFSTYDLIGFFDGTSENTITLYKDASQYAFLIYRLINQSGEVLAIATISPKMARNLVVWLYGGSSSTWGKVKLSADYTQATCNRTSANTREINIYGMGRI